VVVATNTITLQEQLFNKDLPFLKSWLPFDFTAALLKGRGNYVSLRRWNRYLNAPSRRADGSWFAEEIKFKLRMLVWLAQTAHGDRAEIRWNGLDDLFWQRAASTADDCLMGQCDNYRAQRCFYWNSRRAAQDADLIVTNHALLLADALRSGTVLPPHKHVVIDEAHQLEETAVDALTYRVGEAEVQESLDTMMAWYRAGWGAPDARIRAAVALVRDTLAEAFREIGSVLRRLLAVESPQGVVQAVRPGRDSRLVLDGSTRELPEIANLTPLAHRLRQHRQGLKELLEEGAATLLVEPDARAAREFTVFFEQWQARSRQVEDALSGPIRDQVTWLSLERRSGRPLVHGTSTRAGEILYEEALAGKETVVFTSASLAVAQSFQYFKRGVGLNGETYELILPSPFEYLSQALLCLPTDLRDLQDPAFLDQVAQTVASAARAIGGRTLVLFTAHEQLALVADRLRPLLAADRLQVLAQNLDGTRRQLLQEFQEDPRAVLLGTSSFWEGIDIPGATLACVVIVRLPFRVPTDPAQLARSAHLRDSFAELMLPEAVLRLKQGFGRLIRRKTDRGAVVLMDHRVNNRAYGPAFLDALPKAAVHLGTCEEVAPAIARWLQPAT
jgi:Rad3-related DNA helicase